MLFEGKALVMKLFGIKKKITLLIGLSMICMVMAMLVVPVTARASGFDPVYYAAKYPDVVAVVGNSQPALINHYLSYGIAEGRYQNAEEEAAMAPLNTYIDVDLTNQYVKYILNGASVWESPCVSGDVSKGRSTPTGIYAVYGHVKGTYLTGPTWKNWVDYWMPFTRGGCGLHDATWRRKFGGEIYKTNGSHGCVNLPPDKAKELFDMVGIGTVVVVHSD